MAYRVLYLNPLDKFPIEYMRIALLILDTRVTNATGKQRYLRSAPSNKAVECGKFGQSESECMRE